MRKYAIIVAGGYGKRMGLGMPKQFLLLHNKPILFYTIRTFLDAYDDMQIVLVLPKEHVEKGKELILMFNKSDRIKIITGGETRFYSVKNGLQLVEEPAIVFVHDGVRCLVSKNLIQNCYKQTLEKGSAIPAVAATDSIRIAQENVNHVIDRNNVRIIQTPQTFKSNILLRAFKQPYEDSFTDEATVVETSGKEVFLIEGEHSNFKITRPIDVCIAEKLLEEQNLLK